MTFKWGRRTKDLKDLLLLGDERIGVSGSRRRRRREAVVRRRVPRAVGVKSRIRIRIAVSGGWRVVARRRRHRSCRRHRRCRLFRRRRRHRWRNSRWCGRTNQFRGWLVFQELHDLLQEEQWMMLHVVAMQPLVEDYFVGQISQVSALISV